MAAATGEPRAWQESFLFRYALTALAAGVAETVTFPIDLTKTRLQIQGELATEGPLRLPPRRAVATAVGIVREEGFLRLWDGCPPAVLRHFVYSGVRMCAYEELCALLGRSEAEHFPLWKGALVGMASGVVGQFLASPADLVKVQMQLEGRRRVRGLPPRYRNTGDAFRTIYREHGLRGMWTGWLPNVQRAAMVNLGDLTAYTASKQFMLEHTQWGDNQLTRAVASLAASLTAALFGTPADVLKTRIMNQPVEQGRGVLYSGTVDCLLKTVKGEGLMALYKGFFPIWIRMAPWSVTFWLTYEELRTLSGLRAY